MRNIIEHALRLIPRMISLRNRGFGFRQIYRFMINRYNPKRSNSHCLSVKTPENILLETRNDFAQYVHIFVDDCYKARAWKPQLENSYVPVILDVGANLGFFTSLCLSINKSAKVYCFEMLDGLRPYIQKRIDEQSPGSGEIIIAAVTDKQGDVVWVDNSNIFDTSNNIFRQKKISGTSVFTIRLDSWYASKRIVHSPFLIKMDIEGGERYVIPESLCLLSSARFLLIEFHSSSQLLDLLLPTHEIISNRDTGEHTCEVVLRKRCSLSTAV